MTSRDARLVHPLDLAPAIERIVTRGLQNFAKSAEFELRALYHGQSVWYVKRRDNATITRIQVAAFGSASSPELRFIPDISDIDDAEGVIRTSECTPPELIQTVALRVLSAEKTSEDAAAVIERAAWETLKSLRSHDYPKRTREIVIRKPSP